MGLRQTSAQDFLQHHRHRAVGGRALIIGTIELVSILTDKLGIGSVPLAWIANLDLNHVGFFIVGLFMVTWLLALVAWRLARIEDQWSARLKPASGPSGRPTGTEQGTLRAIQDQ